MEAHEGMGWQCEVVEEQVKKYLRGEPGKVRIPYGVAQWTVLELFAARPGAKAEATSGWRPACS